MSDNDSGVDAGSDNDSLGDMSVGSSVASDDENGVCTPQLLFDNELI